MFSVNVSGKLVLTYNVPPVSQVTSVQTEYNCHVTE